MHCLIEQQLWQGNAVEAGDVRAILNLGVQAVVDLAAEEEPIRYPRDILVLRYPIIDGAGNPRWLLESIVSSLHNLLRNEIPTFVYCSAGLSRSPALCSAALARFRDVSMEDALAIVLGERSLDISTALWSELVRFHANR
ncbi:MAG TPA: dual specificity protein phosphatase [Planctomycetaceae bacterium]|nr:dual specificity protein phosphatase [Planctomycetaceae bacterium]